MLACALFFLFSFLCLFFSLLDPRSHLSLPSSPILIQRLATFLHHHKLKPPGPAHS
ncbi:hypothetical protein IE53DRAFT_388907 [Violaceomyces palustris]|uniref:Uncharacterized protein n=1 Tax=Violaceomyces palustris TaxID=1673888 RepID=A0ACD0NSV6_9BASI|nr:hypothetical protein IE53DRAFT_388907 [Violaceomyces palustris]